MIPFLLPIAFAIFGVIGVCLLLLVVGYHVVRPDAALLIERKGALPQVLFSGGIWVLPGRGSVRSIDLTAQSYEHKRNIVVDSGKPLAVSVTLELAVKATSDAVNQVREMLGDKASDRDAVRDFAFARVGAAIEAAAVPGISFDEFSVEAEASIKSALPAFGIESLAISSVPSR